MNGEEFFLNDPNTVLKELPADMIDQLKTYQKNQTWHVSPELMTVKKKWYSTYA